MQQWGPCAVVLAVACGVYLNTLSAGFTFDDNFAVVSPFIDPVHRGRLPSTPVTLQLSKATLCMTTCPCWTCFATTSGRGCHDAACFTPASHDAAPHPPRYCVTAAAGVRI